MTECFVPKTRLGASGGDHPPYGRRLQPHVVDELAQTAPQRVYATFPVSADLSVFRDVTFLELSRAIHWFAWWIDTSLHCSKNFETLAYLGVPDIRYTVVFLAAVKCGYKVGISRKPRRQVCKRLSIGLSFSRHQQKTPRLPTYLFWSKHSAPKFFSPKS